MIKAIIFDCFGVLVQGTLEAFSDTYLKGNPDLIARVRELDRKTNIGYLSYQGFVKEIAKLAKISFTEAQDFLDNTPPNLELLRYIQELKTSYKIGLLSNAAENWLDELFTSDQLALFDDAVISSEVNLVKPDRAIFALAAHRLGCKPEECVMVDDLKRYCDAANEAGMQAVHYKDFTSFKKDLKIILK